MYTNFKLKIVSKNIDGQSTISICLLIQYPNFSAMLIAILFYCGSILSIVKALPSYLAKIPNAENLPGTPAIGHVNGQGGGARNEFGHDFANAGYQWTQALCQADSDGDGLSNGQELGDPCCFWEDGGAALNTSLIVQGISHPGLRESRSTNVDLVDPTCEEVMTSTTSRTDDVTVIKEESREDFVSTVDVSNPKFDENSDSNLSNVLSTCASLRLFAVVLFLPVLVPDV